MRPTPGIGVLALLVGLFAAPAVAQQLERGTPTTTTTPRATPPPSPDLIGSVELSAHYHWLTKGQEDWFGQALRGTVDLARRDIFMFEIVNSERFDDQGVFFSAGYTRVLSEAWYANVVLGTSAGGVFWPEFRADAFLSRKWLETRNLVTTVGVGYNNAKDEHYDYSAFFGIDYYFDFPLVASAGVRYNRSYPGSVDSPSGFIALTWGREKAYYLTARYGFGREAYQIIGTDAALVDFQSEVATVTWKHWLTDRWGFRVQGEYYTNPFYNRTGLEVGVFRDF